MSVQRIIERSPQAAVLVELSNLITLEPTDNPQALRHDELQVMTWSRRASRFMHQIPYDDFEEVVGYLDQSADTFEAYMARQISTLYFLLRLHPLALRRRPQGTERRLAVLAEDEEADPPALFPEGVIESPPHTALDLLANYLTESWNYYSQWGPSRNRREAIARSRAHYLVREVVQIYGSWSWPFFHHFESSVHVDTMLKIVEESDGHIPPRARQSGSDLRPDVRGEE